MTERERLIREVEDLPEPLVSQILDFVRAARAGQNGPGGETAIASERVLGKDWLRHEEDEAWKDL